MRLLNLFVVTVFSGSLLSAPLVSAKGKPERDDEVKAISAFLLDQHQGKQKNQRPTSSSFSLLSTASTNGNDRLATEVALSRMEVTPHITPETTELFGERVDLNSGAIQFEHVDVALRGNSALPVEVRRSYWGSKNNFANNLHFGDWSLELPSLTTTTLEYDMNYMMQTRKGLSHVPGCNGQITPMYVDTQFATVAASSYWSGDILNIPGQTNQKLREGNGTNSDRLADNWKISCLTDRYGFVVTSPEGVVYTLDVLALVPASFIAVDQEGQLLNPDYPTTVLMQTYTLNVQVSRIEDRFGNWVNYTYEETTMPAHAYIAPAIYGEKLLRIEASDGREIEFFYEQGGQGERISQIAADGKTWNYDYTIEFDGFDQVNKDILTDVIRPDGKRWQFDLNFADFGGYQAGTMQNDCQVLNLPPKDSTLEHPNGAVFTLRQQLTQFGISQKLPNNSRCFSSMAVMQKTLTFNNEQLTWHYSYSQNAGSPKTSTLATPPAQALTGLPFTPTGYDLMDLRSTTVQGPDGSRAVHVFHRSYTALEGQQVATFWYDTNGSTLLRSNVTHYDIVAKSGSVRFESCKPQEYPPLAFQTCSPVRKFANEAMHNNHRYVASQTLKTHDGGALSSYTTSYDDYNAYGKPELIYEQSAQGSRYTRTSYQHDTYAWG
ncbi:hypothetical protein ACFOD1_09085 [Pseudidiomarina halophila]|uniref:Insecticide toxin TcdB middle/N-terminal domain-containing protein n=1 Tax=Pseudidiomarina halophila TaxID=1449799 RepID=A0A432Y1C6_9GAMM|nr:hypothetical protein [Pseudidiomarina halophila]RUO54750.1 hypothetical protein CWI69_04915 [Pseudidiomarina halophila]